MLKNVDFFNKFTRFTEKLFFYSRALDLESTLGDWIRKLFLIMVFIAFIFYIFYLIIYKKYKSIVLNLNIF